MNKDICRLLAKLKAEELKCIELISSGIKEDSCF
jgi:hypothetical protein